MRRLALAILHVPLLATGALIGVAQAGTYGCQDQDKSAANHNAQDPTRPGKIASSRSASIPVTRITASARTRSRPAGTIRFPPNGRASWPCSRRRCLLNVCDHEE